ncbi:outer membrane biogenesis protein BamB [Pseudobythopirellula maris]|uniref:Outer membrane biogenesis protein BamB n=1 Tax=Pseudobythopirellula maris TaxID=2527991 RepID=A0A5C5ZJH2_9BACT|nr:PQQ-binding-like beta-propeller repeat protein [Pseudobythopirellula maris]TWT87275.1 outer membrane biogenesis protein BamB [Pseudobythopirellula maris]
MDAAGEAEPAPAIAFEPERVSSRAERRLRQVGALMAEGVWDEAIDLLETLPADEPGKLVEIKTSTGAPSGLFEPVAAHCQRLLAALPAEGLALYRQRVDATARDWLEEGLARRDEALLRRVADELRASSHAGRALLALGEVALERGDVAAARRAWRSCDRRLSGPFGRPLDVALAGIDLDEHGPLVDQTLAEPSLVPGLVVCPEGATPIGDLLARMAVASLRAGKIDAARLEADLLERWAPDAAGRLAGRDGLYVDALREMISAVGERPSADEPIAPLAGWQWDKPIDVASDEPQALDKINPQLAARLRARRQLGLLANLMDEVEGPRVAPQTMDSLLLYSHEGELRAADLATGAPASTQDGLLYQDGLDLNDPAARRPAAVRVLNGQIRLMPGGRVVVGPQRFLSGRTNAAGAAPDDKPITASHGVWYATVRSKRAATSPGGRALREKILGLDLRSEAKPVFDLEPPDESSTFVGSPACDAQRVYAVLAEDELRPRLSVLCALRATGRVLWRTPIGGGQPIASQSAADTVRPGLTLAGDSLYVATNLGAVVAIDRTSGRVRWLSLYDRLPAGDAQTSSEASSRAACVVDADRLFVLPSDSPSLLAFDAPSGARLWSAPQDDPEGELLGVDRGVLVTSGRRVRGHDALTGARRYAWPESDHAGLRGMGRGCLAGGEVFWPTRDALYTLDARTGGLARQPVDLTPLGGEGANVSAASLGGERVLVVAGKDGINVLGPHPAPRKEPEAGLARLSVSDQLSAVSSQLFPAAPYRSYSYR